MKDWILGEKFFAVYPHKNSIRGLWESKWKIACQKSVYPFHDGAFEDFEPIFETLIGKDINDAYTDDYTKTFMPTAKELESKAEKATQDGLKEKAAEYYRRAAVVYRIARFPYVSPVTNGETVTSSLKREAFDRQKEVYLKAASTWSSPIHEVVILHKYRAGNDGEKIPLLVRVPPQASTTKKVPVVLLMTGLDGYRCDNSQRTHELLSRGYATVICEIPGTADCPSDAADPDSVDRLWNSVLDYIGSRSEFDQKKIVAWGLSAGGYYAVRAASTHRDKFLGCVAHGPGTHHFLGEAWLERIDDHEYPFTITKAMAEKFGFRNVGDFRKNGQKKFSLLNNGIVKQKSCRLLILNGVDDGIVPIEDSLLLFNHGSPKEARFVENLAHMGYPDTLAVAYEWFENLLGKEDLPKLKKRRNTDSILGFFWPFN